MSWLFLLWLKVNWLRIGNSKKDRKIQLDFLFSYCCLVDSCCIFLISVSYKAIKSQGRVVLFFYMYVPFWCHAESLCLSCRTPTEVRERILKGRMDWDLLMLPGQVSKYWFSLPLYQSDAPKLFKSFPPICWNIPARLGCVPGWLFVVVIRIDVCGRCDNPKAEMFWVVVPTGCFRELSQPVTNVADCTCSPESIRHLLCDFSQFACVFLISPNFLFFGLGLRLRVVTCNNNPARLFVFVLTLYHLWGAIAFSWPLHYTTVRSTKLKRWLKCKNKQWTLCEVSRFFKFF